MSCFMLSISVCSRNKPVSLALHTLNVNIICLPDTNLQKICHNSGQPTFC